MMRHLLVLVVFATSCYQSPSLASCKYRCGGANNNACPTGYDCVDGMCITNNERCDGDGGVIDGPPIDSPDDDAMLIDAPVCAMPNLIDWQEMVPMPTESNLSQIVVLDANNDGIRDLAVLDASSAIGVFIGNGDGTFAPRQPSSIGASTNRIAVGDFDRDGRRDDIVALNGSSTDITIMTSNGNGFYSPTSFGITTPGSPVDIASPGDLDGDGDDDLVILAGGANPNIAVAKHGAMPQEWTFQVGQMNGLSNPSYLFVGDVDASPPKDALVVQSSGLVTLFPGLAGQVFDAGVNVAVEPNAVAVAAAQMLSTGMRTIVSANSSSDNLSVRHLMSNPMMFGNGGDPTTGGGSRPVAVVLAQVAGNGLPDIVVVNRMTSQFGVFVNLGGSYTTQDTTGTNSNPVDLVVADFDGDLRNDVAVAHMAGSSSTVVVYLNKCIP